MAAHGWSGGASGSSQSPNWNPWSQTPSSDTFEATRRTCAHIESYCRSSTAGSPYASYSAHGTHTAASLHTAAVSTGGSPGGGGIRFSTSGTTNGTIPSACCCSRSRSTSQSSRNADTS